MKQSGNIKKSNYQKVKSKDKIRGGIRRVSRADVVLFVASRSVGMRGAVLGRPGALGWVGLYSRGIFERRRLELFLVN